MANSSAGHAEDIEQLTLHTQPLSARALVEAFLFAHGEPIKLEQLALALGKSEGVVQQLLEAMAEDYQNDEERGLLLLHHGERWQLVTKPHLSPYLAALLPQATAYRVTPAMLETLAIIACRQPLTRSEVEILRGVNSDSMMSKLAALELIEECGRKGRSALYGTTERFLQHFGLSSPQELLDVLPEEERE